MIRVGGAEHVQSMKVLRFQTNFQQRKMGLSRKQSDRGGRETYTENLAGSSVEKTDWLVR